MEISEGLSEPSRSLEAAPVARFKPYRPSELSYLAVVLKIAERCNLDCTYCHVFNGADPTWQRHPKFMSASTSRAVAAFLEEGVRVLGLSSIRIVFQGGEPMLMNPRAFSAMCEVLRSALSSAPNVEFVMQTNATLVTDEWIDLLEHYQIAAGVSLDGYREVHDRWRIDRRGRGTYDQVVRGLRRLQQAALSGRAVDYPAVLAVIDPFSDPRRTYRHLVNELEVRCMNFLLPKNCHDNCQNIPVDAYGAWLVELFDEWTRRDDLHIDVRLFRDALDLFFGRRASFLWGNPKLREWEFAISVASNGDLGPDDEFRAAGFWSESQGFNVHTHSLAEFLDCQVFHMLNRAKRTLPSDCEPCLFAEVCGGGTLLNRYSAANGFNNRSILCSSLQEFFLAVLRYLLRSGVPLERLAPVLRTGQPSL